jgi:ribonuclease HI
MELLIDKHCYREALQLATLPASHPLHLHVKKAARNKPQKHPAPLHEILHAFSLHPANIETIAPVCHLPHWQCPVTTHIAPNRETALEEEEADTSQICVYSDGSGFEGNVSAGVVLYRNGACKGKARYRLGEISRHTVYEGELTGLCLGAELLIRQTRLKDVTFYTDNQAGIQAINSFKPAPGHHLVDSFLKLIACIHCKYPRCTIKVRWIPGHEGIQGNEVADDIAKTAASDGSSHDAILPTAFCSHKKLPYSKSALKQHFFADLKSRNTALFTKSPQCEALHCIDESAPSSAFQKLVRDIPRRYASILVQLRTGHIPLNKFLHRIDCADSPVCPACEGGHESVLHFLVTCPAYEPLRRSLHKTLK